MDAAREDQTVTIVIRLELGCDPIAGWIAVPSASSLPFHGWLELASALEAARADRGSLRPQVG